MNNETFTTRSGKSVAVPSIAVPADVMVTVMRLQEDYAAKGKRLSLTGLVIDLIDKGDKQTRRQWENAERGANGRQFAKKAAMLFDANGNVRDAEALKMLAVEHGLVKGMRITPADDLLNDEELEEATAPAV